MSGVISIGPLVPGMESARTITTGMIKPANKIARTAIAITLIFIPLFIGLFIGPLIHQAIGKPHTLLNNRDR